jgi:hypothetical protein
MATQRGIIQGNEGNYELRTLLVAFLVLGIIICKFEASTQLLRAHSSQLTVLQYRVIGQYFMH